MIENEKCAHDLAILYMQLEIKEGQITLPYVENYKWFVDEYQNLYQKFIRQLESP